MEYMSYCRFRKTSVAFSECLEAIETVDDLETELPPEELTAAKQLYRAAKRYVELFPNIAYEDEG